MGSRTATAGSSHTAPQGQGHTPPAWPHGWAESRRQQGPAAAAGSTPAVRAAHAAAGTAAAASPTTHRNPRCHTAARAPAVRTALAPGGSARFQCLNKFYCLVKTFNSTLQKTYDVPSQEIVECALSERDSSLLGLATKTLRNQSSQ